MPARIDVMIGGGDTPAKSPVGRLASADRGARHAVQIRAMATGVSSLQIAAYELP
jgi:hypothetical protein